MPPSLRLLLGAVVALAVAAGGCGDSTTTRQEEVAERGAEVMPFDLDATTHRFIPMVDGLEQAVVADDPSDAEQVALIRQHLSAELERFRAGDFADPAAIHGDDMPGLAALQEGADRIDITMRELPEGAELRYVTEDPVLVDALHRWGDAQVADHGEHAEHEDADRHDD